MINNCTFFGLIMFALSFGLAVGENQNSEVNERARLTAVSSTVTAHKVAVYVKGLICKSCGLGIKVKARHFSFLDKKQFEKGFKVDVKHQLLWVAVKEGAVFDGNKVAKAVKAAGYEPVHYYIRVNNKVNTFNFK